MDRDSCFRQELPQSVKRPTPPAALQGDGEYHHGDAGDHHDDALGVQAPRRIACATTASTTSGRTVGRAEHQPGAGLDKMVIIVIADHRKF